MLHAYFTPIVLCFVYTSWYFYAYSGTNLLTRCHSAIFCYFCVSEKLHRKYSQNWTKWSPKFLFCCHEDGVQRGDGEGPGGSHTRWWHGCPPGHAMIVWCSTQLGTPRGRYDEHISKFPSVVKPRLNRTSRRKPNFRRWCTLASRHFGQGRLINCLSACSFSPAATWNLHTTQPRTLHQHTMRLSISPVCYNERIERIEW
jgi:hypothetical protein